MTDRTALSQLAHNAGFDLFTYGGCRYHSLSVTCAQQLEGKTHFMSNDTRRYFNAQVHMLRSLFGGMVLGMVESVKNDDNPRVYRATFVDCAGYVIHRDDLSEGFKTKQAAVKDFWKVLGTLTEREVFDNMLARELSAVKAKTARLESTQTAAKGLNNA